MNLFVTVASQSYELFCKNSGLHPIERDDVASIKSGLSLLGNKDWGQILIYQGVDFAGLCKAFGITRVNKKVVMRVDKSDLSSRRFDAIIAVQQYRRKDGEIDPVSVRLTMWLCPALAKAA